MHENVIDQNTFMTQDFNLLGKQPKPRKNNLNASLNEVECKQ